jgi:hypothetical protein
MSSQDTPGIPGKNGGVLTNRGIQPRFGAIYDGCRKLAMNHLAEKLTEMFGKVDDALFECADKAENNKLQTLFFDNMRELRKFKPLIERRFHQCVALNFSNFVEGKQQAQADQAAVEAEQLSIIDNEEFEESLQVSNMASKVRSNSVELLFGLDKRLALMNNGQKVYEQNNPFDPRAIADAFRSALSEHPLQTKIKGVLYGLFERHVMSTLPELYLLVNKQLIEGGLLPNLKYTAQTRGPAGKPVTDGQPAAPQAQDTVARDSIAPGQGSADSGGQQAGGSPQSPYPPGSVEAISQQIQHDPQAFFSDLSNLLTQQRRLNPDMPLLGGTASMAQFAPPGAVHTYSTGELHNALDRLQQASAEDIRQRLQEPLKVIDLKSTLHQQLQAHSSQPGKHALSEDETDVIDLVGMLFDFILDDDNLPDSYKTALSHLHTPYLKVALQNKEIFTLHQHPARLLLNSMAQAGVLYGSDTDERGLLSKIHWVVERVIRSYSGDVQLFEALHEEFGQFVETLKHKVELRERRAVEAAKGRDRLLGARQKAVDLINSVLADRDPPGIIRNFLELTWVDVLVFVILRHGEKSQEWQRSAEAAEQLVWSGTYLDEEGRNKLKEIRLGLLEELRKGLELLGGYHVDGIRRLLQDIVACQFAVQAKQPLVAAKISGDLQESRLNALLGEDIALLQSEEPKKLSVRTRALARQLEEVQFGTWFEFSEKGQVRTLKLSWFSPTTGNYMFVDHQGQRAAMKPRIQLAGEIESGHARILEPEREQPLVDRALGAIYRTFQRFSGRHGDTPKGA